MNMKKIGIIGGTGPQSTELFYHEIIRLYQAYKEDEFPNILINSINLSEYVRSLGDKKSTFNLLKKEISKVQNYVDFIVLPCNTLHFFIEEIREFSKVPIIAIHEEVVKEILKSKIRKVGILGTRITICSNLYQDELKKSKINFERLIDQKEEELNSLIFDKMLYGKNYKEMHTTLLMDIEFLKRKGCDGIILACTELPLFIRKEDVNIKLFASTNILAKSAFERVFR